MTAKQKVLELVKTLGVEIDYVNLNSRYGIYESSMTSPNGFIFETTGHHAACLTGATTAKEIWQGMLQDLKEGLSPCTDTNCGCTA